MKISIGCDHGGYKLAMFLIKYLIKDDIDIFYYGTLSEKISVDYPDYAKRIADDIASFKSDFGLLICKSGTGMSIAANKVRSVRAANCWNVEVAKLAREHNDANVLCLGANFVSTKTAKEILDVFLNTKFATRHLKRIEKITTLENL
ncbi:MAG: ribose 5-phosphate isomerase B [Puniceicoccales bacterium]|jgi:ribose 5-phosphate isomerase B|nr:ribose 5-phosphate isomerase B [Puniceicoccales bacterium]